MSRDSQCRPLRSRSRAVLLRATLVLVLLAACAADEGGDQPLLVPDASDELEPECGGAADCEPEAPNPCRSWACDDGSCVATDLPDGEPCVVDPTVVSQACAAGECQGGDARYACDTIGFSGCCTAAGDVFFCNADELAWRDCAGTCGWDEHGSLYDCDMGGVGSPGGDPPFLCPGEACPDDPCAGRACGHRCAVACGTCEAGLSCTTEGQCEPCTCDGLQCGDDGCGGSCGACADGEHCTAAGQCVAGCGDITSTGCCAGAVLTYCNQAGQLSHITCSPDTCGWNPSPPRAPDGEGWYDCGYEGADPSGDVPLACPDDGIGGADGE